MTEDHVDKQRRRFLTVVTAGVGAVGGIAAAVPFVNSMSPSARAKAAGAPVRIDISKLKVGQMLREEWRGNPVWVVRRSEEMIESLNAVEDELLDPQSSVATQQPTYVDGEFRSVTPEVLVVVGICTHLGCAPVQNFAIGADSGLGEDWQGGFYCPCHGSKFDLAGRVYKGVPAPTNLVVPPHRFEGESTIVVGEDPEGVA
ncbi:MAG: ubiquinol-cytochrome c reductase iron-sulfur subunit [Gammaproteobacteria bacterium]|nr:ubiquinol-cytochrome c reductase iron-sulfur subunit [Gammaproteobacteria bacterium]